MKSSYIIATLVAAALAGPAFSQKQHTQHTQRHTPVTHAPTGAADHAFIQDAINSNNEAMALAQLALQRSSRTDVKQIAGQLLNDHRAAQKKLYSLAHVRDSVAYSAYQATTTSNRLPLTDNLNNRRNRTVVSITPADAATTTPATVAGSTSSNPAVPVNNLGNNPYTGTSYSSTNQTYNGNTSIDNANGINNPNRTDLGSYSGRWTEGTAVVNNQPVTIAAQPASNGITAATTTPSNALPANAVSTANGNSIDNVPYFPNRVTDTVRMTGNNTSFQNTGTNLSFPNNERYSATTPNTRPNNNAGSDYGYNGVVVNNTPTNALNTAPYSNNEINGNIVQTGQMQSPSNPTAVINSSTTSMANNQVGFNNSNANRSNTAAVQARPNTSVVTNSSPEAGRNVTTGTSLADTVSGSTGGAPILAGRVGNRQAAAQQAANGGYSTGTSSYVGEGLNNMTPQEFDKAWSEQVSATQQSIIQKYQAALKKTHQQQLKAYINTVLPLLQGHQYALQQWRMKQ